jgi:hypothetical protein
MRRSVLVLAGFLVVCAGAPLFGHDITRRATFDPLLGPNEFVLTFPPEMSSLEVAMRITGGSFEIQTNDEAGTSKLLSWQQHVAPIDLFGANTGPITITLDAAQPSSGAFDPRTGQFSVEGTFLVEFDDSGLQQFGFISPVSLRGTEVGEILGVGSIGVISMALTGQGAFAGGVFQFSCRTTAGIEYDLPDDEAQLGDVNRDRAIDISDARSMLDFLFSGGSMACPPAAEVNGDLKVDIADPVFVLNFLFQGGSHPMNDPVVCSDGI